MTGAAAGRPGAPEQRPLGRTGIAVSSFCLGTWELGGLTWGPITAEDGVALLRRALDRGVTAYDCSDNYGGGRSEVLLGAAFRGRRREVVYVTKAGWLPGLDGAQAVRLGQGGRDQDFSPAYLRWACELSLRRLQTDHIDVYLLHDPPPRVLRDGAAFETLRELRRAGKIRAYGVSSDAYGAALAIRRHGAQVAMAPFNLLAPDAVHELFPVAAAHGAGILARSPLAGGLLLDEVAAAAGGGPAGFAPFDPRRRVPPARLAAVGRLAEELRFLRQAAGGDLAAAALRFVLAYPQVAAAVTGAMRPEELEADLAPCSPPYLTAATRERAYALVRGPRARLALLHLVRRVPPLRWARERLLWERWLPAPLARYLPAPLAPGAAG